MAQNVIIFLTQKLHNFNFKFILDLTEQHLILKEEMCKDILQLLSRLKAGYCKMRGILLYELVCCLQERRRRVNMVQQNNYQDVEVSLLIFFNEI